MPGWVSPDHLSALGLLSMAGVGLSFWLGGTRPLVGLPLVVVFLALDWASFIRPLQGLNITPWNPQPALAVALLMASRRLWWVVIGGLLAAEVVVRGTPGELVVVALAAAALTCSYLAMAAALERRLGGGWQLASAGDVAWFLVIISLGALLSGVEYVGTYAAGGVPPPGPLWQALARYWVGDAVGMTVMLPTLLVVMDAERRATLARALRQGSWWAMALAIVALLGLLFGGDLDSLGYACLLLPIIWASMRFGLAGAVLAAALTQIGLIVAVQSGPHQDLFVFELQLLMASITTTGLLLGVTVDERARSDAELCGSLPGAHRSPGCAGIAAFAARTRGDGPARAGPARPPHCRRTRYLPPHGGGPQGTRAREAARSQRGRVRPPGRPQGLALSGWPWAWPR
jgi:integral membrane sensor domain MASE1